MPIRYHVLLLCCNIRYAVKYRKNALSGNMLLHRAPLKAKLIPTILDFDFFPTSMKEGRMGFENWMIQEY